MDRISLALTAILALAPPLAAKQTAIPFSARDYLFHPFGWQADAAGLRGTGPSSGIADLRKAPVCRTATMEADLVVTQAPAGDDWHTAAVAIVRDSQNFWHFGMVEAPASANRPNFFELSEMRDGIWNAHGNLEVLHHEVHGSPWQPGKSYRLRLAMTPDAIEGTAHDASGKLVMRMAISLTGAPAVTSGRPALRSLGLTSKFTGIQASWDPDTAAQPAKPTFPPYQSDSFVAGLGGKPTGFFRVEKRAGKWWAFDPLGRGFVPLGVDHVTYQGHWCEQLGYSPYHRKMQELYPNRDDWVRETSERLSSWGFNRLGAQASPPMIHQGLNYSRFISVGTPMANLGDEFDITPNEGHPCSAFPNVFHPDFEAYCRYQAEIACRPCVGDPWLFGYFLDNELAWWGRGSPEAGLFDAVMGKPASHSAKVALRDFLASRYHHDISQLNTAWGSDIRSFDSILRKVHLTGSSFETVRADKAAFLALVAERYFSCTTKAIRAIDPDHLILGCRFAGGRATADVWAAAARYCDVLTINYYGNVDLDRGIALDDEHGCRGDPLGVPFARFVKLARDRPLMVTEWSFIALDSCLPCTNGAGQRFRTQAERAKAASIFAETLLRIPEVIGFDYFMWSDEPALGISSSFPENSNYGLVNGDNEIYQTHVASLSAVLKQAGQLHHEGPRTDTDIAPPPPPPTVARLLDHLDKPAEDDRPQVSFRMEGAHFVIRNGKLTLQGPLGPGPVLTSMRLDGVELGRYVTTAQQLVGSPEWPRSNFVTSANGMPAPNRFKVDLTSRFRTGSPDSRPRSFEIVQRIHLLPEADWFLVEFISYRNTSPQPVELGGIYFQIFSALGGDAAHDQPASGDIVPRLWGRRTGDAWIDETVNAFIGMTAPRSSPLKARFWLNDDGGQHPDAHWTVGRILAPGQTLKPDQPVYWIVTAGRGGHDAWNTRLQMLDLD